MSEASRQRWNLDQIPEMVLSIGFYWFSFNMTAGFSAGVRRSWAIAKHLLVRSFIGLNPTTVYSTYAKPKYSRRPTAGSRLTGYLALPVDIDVV